MKKLHVIKIGGLVLNHPHQLDAFLKEFNALKGLKILIHGGGKQATEVANSLGIKQELIEGRRVTDAATLNVAIMVYAGLINKTIVAKLQAQNCNAMGFSGADGNLVTSKIRIGSGVDFGHVGDIFEGGVNVEQINKIVNAGLTPIICAITHDGKGNLLNTNADTMASKIAAALVPYFEVSLSYCFEKNGVLMRLEDDTSYLPSLKKEEYLKLKSSKQITQGMIPKLDTAFEAVEKNVKQVVICNAQNIATVNNQLIGTQLIQL